MKHLLAFIFIFVLQMSSAQAQVSITATDADEQTIAFCEQTVTLATSLYDKEFNTSLLNPVEIVLAKDKSAFINELINRCSLTEKKAQEKAELAYGVSYNQLIIINIGELQTPERIAFNISHELVHQYQNQISPKSIERNRWLIEGMADMYAAYILDKMGLVPLTQTVSIWADISKDSRIHFSNLKTPEGWYEAIRTIGADEVYAASALKAIHIDQNDPSRFVHYLIELNNVTNESQAFYNVYGYTI